MTSVPGQPQDRTGDGQEHRYQAAVQILQSLAGFREADTVATPSSAGANLVVRAAEQGQVNRPALHSAQSLAEVRYRTLVEQMPVVTFLAALDEGDNELYVSPQIESLLGFSQKEWLENPVLWYTQLHPDDRARWHTEFARTCAAGERFRSEYRFLSRAGEVVWVQGEAQMLRDASGRPVCLLGTAFDITPRKQAEESLRRAKEDLERQVLERTAELAESNQSLKGEIAERQVAQEQLLQTLREREVLLKEIHHRVKNNLQIISSLLNLQMATLTDTQMQQVLRESQNRLKSVALIHEKLYQSRDLGRTDFAGYLRDLCGHLARAYSAAAAAVTLQIDVGEVFFDIDTAIPCGLIVNELVTNCFKHAFAHGRHGQIEVRLQAEGAARFALDVKDDGVGFPENLDFRATSSLGLQLVTALTDQLGGTVEMSSSHGTHFRILFSQAATRKRD